MALTTGAATTVNTAIAPRMSVKSSRLFTSHDQVPQLATTVSLRSHGLSQKNVDEESRYFKDEWTSTFIIILSSGS